jgi:hypothetical protein
MKKSPWLKDFLESQRVKELVPLLCVTDKTIRSWMEKGFLQLPFNLEGISDLFADEPIFRFLDEHPGNIDLSKCSAKHPEWFAKYAAVKGRYAKKHPPVDKERAMAAADDRYYLALK